MDMAALADFNLVAHHGGFGRASRASGRPKASLSRRVMELEESLGVRLLERGMRTLRLTEAGAALHQRTRGLMSDINEVGKSLIAAQDAPRGLLRVSAPQLFAHVAMARLAAEFVQRYPEVSFDVTAEDRAVDLVEEEYDVAIRVNPRPDATLVGRCFFRDQILLVAPASIAYPTMRNADGALPLRAVVLANTPEPVTWRISDDKGRTRLFLPEPVMRLSSLLMVRDAVRANAGAALLPLSIIGSDLARGRLVRWGIADQPVEMWVLHTSRRLVSNKVTAFVRFLCESYSDGPGPALSPIVAPSQGKRGAVRKTPKAASARSATY